MRNLKHHLLLILAFFAFAQIGMCALKEGGGSYSYKDKETGNRMDVWYYKPVGFTPDTPVVIVMHGMNRNGEAYRDSWALHAKTYNFMLLVPEFSKTNFPTSNEYNLGNCYTSGRLNSKSQWSFTILERIFSDFTQTRERTNIQKYYLYGHSAGAQFVHRMVLFLPEARIKMAISANAGFYTMPHFSAKWPYGLKGTGMNKETISRYLTFPMIILLGGSDNNPDHPQLNRSEEANEQGIHRLERGINFFNFGKTTAEKLNVKFGWKNQIVPRVGHDDRKMSAEASRIFHNDIKKEIPLEE